MLNKRAEKEHILYDYKTKTNFFGHFVIGPKHTTRSINNNVVVIEGENRTRDKKDFLWLRNINIHGLKLQKSRGELFQKGEKSILISSNNGGTAKSRLSYIYPNWIARRRKKMYAFLFLSYYRHFFIF